VIGNLYAQGEAGASFVLNKDNAGYTRSSSFVYAPQVGYEFKFAKGNYLHTGVRFESNTGLSNFGNVTNFIGPRAAYGFVL